MDGTSKIRGNDVELTAEDVGALPIEGGTLSGYLYFQNHGFINANEEYTYLAHQYNDILKYLVVSSNYDATDAVKFIHSGVQAYNLFGEHNKPSGSYYGDNTTNTRTINIGGIGDILVVTYDAHISFVHSEGAVCFYTDGRTDIQTYSASIVSFADGIFTTKTNIGFFNGGGCQYKWRLL